MEQLVGSLCKRHAVAAYAAPTACRRTVSGSIALPCSGFFSPFLHSTGSLSVFWSYLALRDGPRRFRQDSSCPALLRWFDDTISITCTGLSPSSMKLSRFFHLSDCIVFKLLQPRNCRNNSGLGSFHFARHYFGNRLFLSLPAGTKMFQFSAFAHSYECIQPSAVWVAPFGYRRIISCWQIPVAFRSLPRPSSPPKAQASSVRSCLLRLTCVYFALE